MFGKEGGVGGTGQVSRDLRDGIAWGEMGNGVRGAAMLEPPLRVRLKLPVRLSELRLLLSFPASCSYFRCFDNNFRSFPSLPSRSRVAFWEL